MAKIEAEKIVLDANASEGKLATCALRPSAIFGEGDTVLVPTLVDRAKKGKMKVLLLVGPVVCVFARDKELGINMYNITQDL